MKSIDLLPRGWEQDAWLTGFYPDDLPEDWRLCYFANEFSSVLLPRAVWVDAADDAVEGWAEDLPVGFRCYLEVASAASAASGRKLDAVLSALGRHAAGVVCTGGAAVASGCVSFSFCESPATAALCAGPVACSIPGSAIDDLPAARRLLEALARRPASAPAVVVLNPVSSEALHRWWQLAYLAGLA